MAEVVDGRAFAGKYRWEAGWQGYNIVKMNEHIISVQFTY